MKFRNSNNISKNGTSNTYSIYIGLIIYGICGLLISGIYGLKTYAQNPTPTVDMEQTIEITIDLEDESRFMGVDIYRIGEYDGERFEYLPEYRQLVDKDYYMLDTKKQIYTSIDVIAEYIEENEGIKPDSSTKIVNGKGKKKELPLGLYLIVQNDEDHNAQLNNVIITEAPVWDTNENIYLYDLRLFPKWERTIWFSFRPEVVYPLVIVLLMVICTLLCLFGIRLMRSLGLLSIFLLTGLCGMKLGETITKEFIWMMVFFIIFAFLGIGIIWIALAVIGNITRKVPLFEKLKRLMCWLIPIFSGLALSYLIYQYVSKLWWFYVMIPVIMAIVGEILQYRRKKTAHVFYTYEDLVKLNINSAE